METETRICSIEGCPNKSQAKTWCTRHYKAWRMTGNPLGLESERKVYRRGDSGKPRWDQYPDAEVNYERKQENQCSVIGCEKGLKNTYFCYMHDSRMRTYKRVGPVESVKELTAGQRDEDGWTLYNGYKVKWDSQGNRIHQHREVYSNFLNRPLEKWENVHHKNGDRADNHIENLELWITQQPSGQRIEDLIDFYILNYRELVIQRLSL